MESSSHNFKELKSGELITIVNELSNVFLHLLDRCVQTISKHIRNNINKHLLFL